MKYEIIVSRFQKCMKANPTTPTSFIDFIELTLRLFAIFNFLQSSIKEAKFE